MPFDRVSDPAWQVHIPRIITLLDNPQREEWHSKGAKWDGPGDTKTGACSSGRRTTAQKSSVKSSHNKRHETHE